MVSVYVYIRVCVLVCCLVYLLDTGSVLLSSCGQDGFIRLWSISRSLFEKNHLRRSVADLSPDDDIRMKENTFSVCDDCELFV